jgi:Ca2+:H+ antiporter
VTGSELQRFGAVLAVSVVAVVLHFAGTSGQIVFFVAAVALAALAWALAEATEQAGESAGPRASALLNATFGNLPEVVIVVLAIRAGLDDIARASIIGSVIGNIMLVLGLSLVIGGWRNGAQRFTEKVATINSSMLALGVAGLGLPTLFAALEHDPNATELLSRWTGGALVVVYAAYLYFSFQQPALRDPGEPGGLRWSRTQALILLAAAAIGTGVVSEVLVDSIKPTVEALGVPRPFVGLVIVPFVGNVAEHFSAVRLAYRNRLDFAMGIAYGSGIQIVLVASAVAVLAGVVVGNPLTLVFDPFQLAARAAAALGSTLIARGGETNWLEGLQLLTIYLVVSVAVWLR